MAAISVKRTSDYLAVGDAATDTTSKGRALEDAVEYIFSKLAGVSLFERNQVDAFGCAESDLIFINDPARSNLGFLDWGLIVECKNLSRAVGSADVEYFRGRLADKAARTGILVAAGGLSGRPGTHAYHAVESALHYGVHILVLTRADLEALRSTTDLVGLLLRRYMKLKASGTLDLS